MTVSCKKSRASGGSYYTKCANLDDGLEVKAGRSVDDYYSQAKEPPGVWYSGVAPGTDSRANGLGVVDGQAFGPEDGKRFAQILRGFHPDTKAPLVQNAGSSASRVAFFDMTTSAPKSVSVVWSQANEELKAQIEQAQLESSRSMLDLLSSKAYSRQGKGSKINTPVALVAAQWSHASSRANDPQLHTHNTFFNVSERPDGTTGALETKGLFSWQGAGASLYHCDLANKLRKLNFEIQREGNLFEIAGVPEPVCQFFSKRRAQIVAAVEKEFKKMGMDPKTAKHYGGIFDKVAQENRNAKGELTREQLESMWHKAGRELGFTAAEVEALRVPPQRDLTTEELREAAQDAVRELNETEAYFSEPLLLTKIAVELMGRASSEEILRSFEEIKREQLLQATIVNEKTNGEELVFTTREMLAVETNMLRLAAEAQKDQRHKLENVVLPETLDPEQRAAALKATSDGALSVIEGTAGAGKTFTVSLITKAFEELGYRSIALSSGWEQALDLQKDAHKNGAQITEARALAKLFAEYDRGDIAIDQKTLLVVDEAGMVGARDMHRLLQIQQETGAKLILLGDTKQQGSVSAGRALDSISQQNGSSRLDIIRRQHDERQREAVHQFFDGKAKEGLEPYLANGHVHIITGEEAVHEQMIKDWDLARTEHPEKSLLMIATTNESVLDLNLRAHEARKEKGELGESVQLETMDSKKGKLIEFSEHDRVQFRVTRMDSKNYVANRNQGEIMSVQDGNLHIRLDNGEMTVVNPQDLYWQHKTKDGLAIQHAYANTTYSSQGKTVDRVLVAESVGLDRASAGVAMSRHREQCDVYVDRQARYESKMRQSFSDDWHPISEFSNDECIARMARSWSAAPDKKSTLDVEGWRTPGGPAVDRNLEAQIARVQASAEKAQSEIDRIREESKETGRFLATAKEAPFQQSERFALKPLGFAEGENVTRAIERQDALKNTGISEAVIDDARQLKVMRFNDEGKELYIGRRPSDGAIVNHAYDDRSPNSLRDRYPPIFEGSKDRTAIVSKGEEAMQLWTYEDRKGFERSTVIVAQSERAFDLQHVTDKLNASKDKPLDLRQDRHLEKEQAKEVGQEAVNAPEQQPQEREHYPSMDQIRAQNQAAQVEQAKEQEREEERTR